MTGSGEVGRSDREAGLTEVFEAERPQLRAIAYRMLGSAADADDAVQEAWLRAARADVSAVQNLAAWLTTVVARICLNELRSRQQRRPEGSGPVPVLADEGAAGPEESALLRDRVGLALLVVLDSLSPGERLAFVLHDMFGVAFEEIAQMLHRSPAATRKLASRARRRVEQQAPSPERDRARQRHAVDAFLAASREGDFDALVAVLHPDAVLRSDGGAERPRLTRSVSGARQVASEAILAASLVPYARPVLVDGAAGLIVVREGRVEVVMGFTVVDGVIATIDILADPVRLARLDLSPIEGPLAQAASSTDATTGRRTMNQLRTPMTSAVPTTSKPQRS